MAVLIEKNIRMYDLTARPAGPVFHAMFYALDALDLWVDASDASRDGRYTCDCPDRHPVCLKLPSGRANVEYRAPHFSHLSNAECRGGGESAEHKAAKHQLRKMKGQYWFVTERCPECDREKRETCANGTVSIEIRSTDDRWRYDCVYKPNAGPSIALEVFHTHATTKEKIEATRRSGMQIAEFKADEINAMEPGAKLCNLQTVIRTCGEDCEFARSQRERRKRRHAEELRAEREEIERQLAEEKQEEIARQLAEKKRAADERLLAEARLAELAEEKRVAKEKQLAEERLLAEARLAELAEEKRVTKEKQLAEVRQSAWKNFWNESRMAEENQIAEEKIRRKARQMAGEKRQDTWIKRNGRWMKR